MVALFAFFALSAFLSVQVMASPAPVAPALIHSLLARQTTAIDPSIVPSECKSDCSSIVDISSKCSDSDAKCICSDSTMSAVVSCLNCAVKLSGNDAIDQNTAQTAADQFVAECKAAGSPVNSVEIAGGNSTSGPSTGSNSKNGAQGVQLHAGVLGVVVAASFLLL